MTKRTLALLTFVLSTLILTAVVFYTAYYYFDVYRATHFLDIRVEKFNITILNSTYATTQTNILLLNPSKLIFDVIYVEERLTYDTWGQFGQYITGKIYWFDIPRPLQPFSNMTLTMDATAPKAKIEVSKTVYAEVRIFLKGPLVGEFLLNSYETLYDNYGDSQ